MSEPQWFLVRQGQQYGPIPQAKLQELAAQGQLAPTDMVRRADQQELRPANQVAELTFAAPADAGPALPGATLTDPAGAAAKPAGKKARKRPLSKKQRILILVLAVLNVGALALVIMAALHLKHFKAPPMDRDVLDTQPAQTQTQPAETQAAE